MTNIDLKNLKNEYDVGFIGEHNAEKLNIDISSLKSSDISFFVCVFCNGYAETYNSERYYVKDMSDNSINTVLSQSLTKTSKCKMIVGAYGEDENGKINLLKKSDIVNLHFLDSLDDTNAVYKPEIEGLYKELVDLENKFNNGLDLLESNLESIAAATAGANTAATAATAVANDIKQKSENGYFNGAKGDKGDPGTPGKDGINGKDGYTPIKGVDYFDGAKGDKGDKGDRGEQGIQGIQGLPGEKGEKGEQGIQGVQGEKGEKGEPGTTDYNELANVPVKNINLTLQNYTFLADIEDGMYFVQSTGYIKTTGGKVVGITVGTEIIVVTYSGVKAMTYQTGKTVSFLNDSMTLDDKVYSWLNTSHKDLSISSAATDDTLPTSKAVYDFVTAQVSQKQNDWELIRTVTVPENPEEDNSDIIWKTKIVDDKNYVIGFAFDRDNNGEEYELSDFFADGTVKTKIIGSPVDNLSIYNDDKLICSGYRNFISAFSWTMFFINFGYKCIPLILAHDQFVQNYSVVSFTGNVFYNNNLFNTNQSWTKIGFSSGGHICYDTGTKIKFYGKRRSK